MSNLVLDFVRTSKTAYNAKFAVSGDFNLHVEGNYVCVINVSQATNDALQPAKVISYRTKVIDSDFAGLIYPKTISVDVSLAENPVDNRVSKFSVVGIVTGGNPTKYEEPEIIM